MTESPLTLQLTRRSHSPHPPLPACGTFGHELCDDVDGLLCDHGMQLHQLVVLQSFHQVGFCQERVHRHAPGLHRLHGHLGVLVVGGWSGTGSRKGGQDPLLFPHSSGRPGCRPASSRMPSLPISALRERRGDMGFGLRQMWVGGPVYHYLAVCPWASHSTSLNCGFLICKGSFRD